MDPIANGKDDGDGYFAEDLNVDAGKFSLDSLDMTDEGDEGDGKESKKSKK